MKDYARKFYLSRAWRNTQSAYMNSQHYVCERCGSLARIVHHKQHITPGNVGNIMITLNWDNLEALCIECHNTEHGICEATTPQTIIAPGLRFTATGDIEVQ